MDELMDMITTDESPSQISDKIKEILFAKSSEKIEGSRSTIANTMFNNGTSEEE
jgi:hypothetical protein